MNTRPRDYDITAAPNNLAAANYYFTYADATNGLTVTPATLTVTADNQTRAFGAGNPTFTQTLTGYVNGDDITAITGTDTGSSTANATSAAGNYAITASSAGYTASNYTFVTANGLLTITPPAGGGGGGGGGSSGRQPCYWIPFRIPY